MRLPRRPVLYPAVMLGTFVLSLIDQSRVSPWAGLRSMVVVLAVGVALTFACSGLLRDRDRGALLALATGLLLVMGGRPWMAPLLTSVIGLLLVEWFISRRRPLRVRWPMVTRTLGTFTAILLLAVVIRAVQDGRAIGLLTELVAEAPGLLAGSPAAANAGDVPQTPDVYLVLLDGYPRADKLTERFNIDNAPFVEALQSRGFTVAAHSRSNYPETRMTLASMFNGAHLDDLASAPDGTTEWRRAIDEGRQLAIFRSAGYRVVSVSSGYEDAVLRRADEFIDTGQVGELERPLLALSIARAVAPGELVDFLVANQGERTGQSFDAANRIAGQGGPPRFAFVHIMSPHAPLAFATGGSGTAVQRPGYPVDDRQEAAALGGLYARLLAVEVAYVNDRTLELVDAIRASQRDAVIVVFSDHGSGVDFSELDARAGNLDLRTANLLAVSTPNGTDLIDDRSTLINLLPRIAHLVLGSPLREAPEDIRTYPDEGGPYVTYARPD